MADVVGVILDAGEVDSVRAVASAIEAEACILSRQVSGGVIHVNGCRTPAATRSLSCADRSAFVAQSP